MRINVDALVSISEANQNFSRVARLVDEQGVALILKNGAPRYVLLAYDALGGAADEDVADAGARAVAAQRDAIERALADADNAAPRYCPGCLRMTVDEDGRCPACGETLRAPQPNDPVLLLSLPPMKADMVRPLLEDSGIPFSMEGEQGVGFSMRAGGLNETYHFFVPYGARAQCYALLESVFGQDDEIMRALDQKE